MGFWHNMDLKWEENYLQLVEEKEEKRKKMEEEDQAKINGIYPEKRGKWARLKLLQFFCIYMSATIILIIIYLLKTRGML